MTGMIDKMKSWVSLLPPIGYTNILEIIILAVLVYEFLLWIKNTRAWELLKGLLVIAAFITAAAILHLTTIMWLIERISTAAIIATVVIFQPELRKALEQLGSRNFIANLIPDDGIDDASVTTINEIIRATFEMAKKKTEKNTPLHDGAVTIVGDKVTAATCYLPLSDTDISKDFGTRHRAALGMSETSDAVTIVVSEETGRVSVAANGKLCRAQDAEALRSMLPTREQKENDKNTRFRIFRNTRKEGKA